MCGLTDFAATALARLNELRASGADCGSGANRGRASPAGPLAWNLLLMQAAHAHASDMATRDYLSHSSPDGRSVADRISATGYVWRHIGEDLAGGHPTIESAIDGWMASPSHCTTLMNPKLIEAAMACVSGSSRTTYRTYWALEVAQPR